MEIRRFWSAKASVIFVWAGEEDLDFSFDMMRFVLPPRNRSSNVREDGTRPIGSPYTHPPARDEQGRPMPGTIVVEDMTDTREGGGFTMRLSVDQLCRFLTRDREDLFRRGFNIVQNVRDVPAAMEACRPLYDASQDERARQVLATELERQKRFAEKGQPAPPSSSAHLVDWAIKHLHSRPAQTVKYSSVEITKVLEGQAVTLPKAPAIGLSDAANASLFDEAEQAGVKLSPGELKGLLRNDPETVAIVAAKIKARQEDLEKDAAEERGALV